MRHRHWLYTTLLWLAANVTAAPVLGQFQTHFPLIAPAGSAYYQLTLTEQAYQASRRADCADMRVFNATGEVLPYAVSLPTPPTAKRQTPNVPWFALPPQTAQRTPQTNGLIIDGNGQLRAAPQQPQLPQRGGDIVDLSQTPGKVEALQLTLQDDSYRGAVNVSVSDDLQQWREIGQNQLLKLGMQGQQLRQERIELNGESARYVLLQWPSTPPTIATVRAETSVTDQQPATARQWTPATALTGDTGKGDYRFESNSCFSSDRLRIHLSQPNTVAQATLYSRAAPQDAWQPVWQTTLYRLHDANGDQENPPFALPPSDHRYWRLQVDTSGGGLGQGLPGLVFGWQPATLTFVARGQPPFTLAVGNAQTGSETTARTSLLLDREQAVATAKLGAASHNPVKQTPQAVNYRPYLLWAALLAAVALLGWMAWRLTRPIDDQQQD